MCFFRHRVRRKSLDNAHGGACICIVHITSSKVDGQGGVESGMDDFDTYRRLVD